MPFYSRDLNQCYLNSILSDVGGSEGHEKPINPIKVFSERELTKEFEKIVSLLKAEHDWSIRMAAMQKLEGIIIGGLTIVLNSSI